MSSLSLSATSSSLKSPFAIAYTCNLFYSLPRYYSIWRLSSPAYFNFLFPHNRVFRLFRLIWFTCLSPLGYLAKNPISCVKYKLRISGAFSAKLCRQAHFSSPISLLTFWFRFIWFLVGEVLPRGNVLMAQFLSFCILPFVFLSVRLFYPPSFQVSCGGDLLNRAHGAMEHGAFYPPPHFVPLVSRFFLLRALSSLFLKEVWVCWSDSPSY